LRTLVIKHIQWVLELSWHFWNVGWIFSMCTGYWSGQAILQNSLNAFSTRVSVWLAFDRSDWGP